MNFARLIAIILFFAALSAEAAIPAFCGDTVRGKASESCPSPDGDNDGYTTDGTGLGYDCDDTNMWIYPGETTTSGCSAGQFKTCQTNGTYGSCGGITCSNFSTSNTCKYVDFDSGNDSTGDGSAGNPWKSLKMVGSHYSTTPTGWYDVNPGDTVFVSGTANSSSHYYEYQSGGGVYYYYKVSRTAQGGTSGNYVTIMSNPTKSSRAVFDSSIFSSSSPKGSPIELYSTQYVKIKNVEIGGGGYLTKYDGITGDGGLVWGEDSNYITLENNYIHDAGCEENYNCSAVYFTGSPTGHIYTRNVMGDVYDPLEPDGSDFENNTIVVLFRGGGHSIKYNVLYYSQSGSDTTTKATGNVLKYKHAMTTPATSASTEISNNVFLNGLHSIQSGQPHIWIHNNRMIEPGWSGYNFKEPGGLAFMIDYIFEYNTVVNGECVTGTPHRTFNCDGTTAVDACSGCDIDDIITRFNVCIDDDTSYTGDDGMQYFYSYSPDGIYNDFITDAEYRSDNNCYYNPNTTVKFSAFRANDGNTACSGRGNLGGQYPFASWQALGFDTNSYVENPTLNSDHLATSTNCSNKGWSLVGGTTTTTTTTTTSTTLGSGGGYMPFVQ